MMQTIIATMVVLIAGFLVARRGYRVVMSATRPGEQGNCGSCGGCSANRKNAPEHHSVPVVSIGGKTSSFQAKH